MRDPQIEADYYDRASRLPIVEVWLVGGFLMLGAVFARFLLIRWGAW